MSRVPARTRTSAGAYVTNRLKGSRFGSTSSRSSSSPSTARLMTLNVSSSASTVCYMSSSV